jgi:hypothetical protein
MYICVLIEEIHLKVTAVPLSEGFLKILELLL